jgi:superfamily II DNA/RNA helicase
MITFHHRTIEAQAFAEGLPHVVKQLHAADQDKYPAKVWSDWLQGEHTAERRRQVLGDFATRAGRAILSNCKVLGEGVDIRAVDSVALLDPKARRTTSSRPSAGHYGRNPARENSPRSSCPYSSSPGKSLKTCSPPGHTDLL